MLPKADSHDLAVGKSRLLHVELPSWKILLLGPMVYRGDYPANQRDMKLVDGYPGFLNHFPPLDSFSPNEGRKVGSGTT